MPHPDEVFATNPLDDEWLGFSKEPKEQPRDPLTDLEDDWRRKRSRLNWLGAQRYLCGMPPPDPQPTFEERVARCREMGLVICTCTGVDRGEDQPRVLVFDPQCEVHGKVWKVA